MVRLLLNWLLSAVALIIVSYVVPGFYLSGLLAALWAAAVIGLINASLGLLLKVVTFPLTVITLGLFWFVINALMLLFATWFAPGFEIRGFGAAFIAAVLLALTNLLFRWLAPREAGD